MVCHGLMERWRANGEAFGHSSFDRFTIATDYPVVQPIASDIIIVDEFIGTDERGQVVMRRGPAESTNDWRAACHPPLGRASRRFAYVVHLLRPS